MCPNRQVLAAALVVAAGLLATSTVQAARVQARSIEVAPYQRVHLVGDVLLYLEQNQAAQTDSAGIELLGTPQSLRDLVIHSSDGVLFIDAGQRRYPQDLVIHLSVRQLQEVLSEGKAFVRADGLVAQTLALEGHGVSRFDLRRLDVQDLTIVGEDNAEFEVSGAAQNQFIDLQGLGSYKAQALASQTTQATIRGDGHVALWVEELLDVNIFGDAEVSYSGQPWVVQQVSGRGAIRRVGH